MFRLATAGRAASLHPLQRLSLAVQRLPSLLQQPPVSRRFGSSGLCSRRGHAHAGWSSLPVGARLGACLQPVQQRRRYSSSLNAVYLRDAVLVGHTKRVRHLLSLNCDPDQVDETGETPLILAAKLDSLETIYLLAKAGADLDCLNAHKRSALMFAAWNGQGRTLAFLIGAGADPSLCDVDGKSALDYALMQRHWECAALILDHRAQQPGFQQDLSRAHGGLGENNSPLMLAVRYGEPADVLEVMQRLRETGTLEQELCSTNALHQRACDIAQELGQEHMAQALYSGDVDWFAQVVVASVQATGAGQSGLGSRRGLCGPGRADSMAEDAVRGIQSKTAEANESSRRKAHLHPLEPWMRTLSHPLPPVMSHSTRHKRRRPEVSLGTQPQPTSSEFDMVFGPDMARAPAAGPGSGGLGGGVAAVPDEHAHSVADHPVHPVHPHLQQLHQNYREDLILGVGGGVGPSGGAVHRFPAASASAPGGSQADGFRESLSHGVHVAPSTAADPNHVQENAATEGDQAQGQQLMNSLSSYQEYAESNGVQTPQKTIQQTQQPSSGNEARQRLVAELVRSEPSEVVRGMLTPEDANIIIDPHGNTPLLMAAMRGDLHMMDSLVRLGSNPRHANEDGQTAMHWCAMKGLLQNLRVLAEAGGDILALDKNGFAPVHLAATVPMKEFVSKALMLSPQPDPDFANPLTGDTPLMVAVACGNRHGIFDLLRLRASLQLRNHAGQGMLDLVPSSDPDLHDLLSDVVRRGGYHNSMTRAWFLGAGSIGGVSRKPIGSPLTAPGVAANAGVNTPSLHRHHLSSQQMPLQQQHR